jgi:hypothetical protein
MIISILRGNLSNDENECMEGIHCTFVPHMNSYLCSRTDFAIEVYYFDLRWIDDYMDGNNETETMVFPKIKD